MLLVSNSLAWMASKMLSLRSLTVLPSWDNQEMMHLSS